eukprot:2704743-Heterocapsa_arctica.AAC.1
MAAPGMPRTPSAERMSRRADAKKAASAASTPEGGQALDPVPEEAENKKVPSEQGEEETEEQEEPEEAEEPEEVEEGANGVQEAH